MGFSQTSQLCFSMTNDRFLPTRSESKTSNLHKSVQPKAVFGDPCMRVLVFRLIRTKLLVFILLNFQNHSLRNHELLFLRFCSKHKFSGRRGFFAGD